MTSLASSRAYIKEILQASGILVLVFDRVRRTTSAIHIGESLAHFKDFYWGSLWLFVPVYCLEHLKLSPKYINGYSLTLIPGAFSYSMSVLSRKGRSERNPDLSSADLVW